MSFELELEGPAGLPRVPDVEAMMDSMTYCNLFKENNDSTYI